MFTASITRVGSQIRQEYISLIFSHACLTIDVYSDFRIWGAFTDAVGEDVLKLLAGLQISNLLKDIGSDSRGSPTICISLHELENPVEWS